MIENTLIQAVLNEDVEAVALLLQQGISPNVCEDTDKITPLHFVAQKDSEAALKIAQLLMDAGADPSAQTDPDGQTPIEVAKLMSNVGMLAVLSGAGREVH